MGDGDGVDERGPARKVMGFFQDSVIPFTPFDNIDIALRTAMAVTAMIAIVLYADEEWVADELPFFFVGIILAVGISNAPFLSAQLSLGISHICGLWVAVLVAWLTITALGTDTVQEEYQDPFGALAIIDKLDIPCNCTSVCKLVFAAIAARSGTAAPTSPAGPGPPAAPLPCLPTPTPSPSLGAPPTPTAAPSVSPSRPPSPTPTPLPPGTLIGEVGEVNEVALGRCFSLRFLQYHQYLCNAHLTSNSFIVFIETFLFSLLGTTDLWALGAAVFVNVFLASWYTAMISPDQESVEIIDFVKQARGYTLAIVFLMVAFALPLPRLSPTFIPQPRLAFPTIMLGLGKMAGDVSKVFSRLGDKYKMLLDGDPQARSSISRINIKSKLVGIEATLDKMRVGMFVAARWEPYFVPMPIPYITTGKNLAAYLGKMKVALVLLENINESIFSGPDISGEGPTAQLAQTIEEASHAVADALEEDQDFRKCCGLIAAKKHDAYLEHKEALKGSIDRIVSTSGDVVQVAQSNIDDLVDVNDSAAHNRFVVKMGGFHCFLMANIMAMVTNVQDMCQLSHEPDDAKTCAVAVVDWPLRVFVWLGEYIAWWATAFRDAFLVFIPASVVLHFPPFLQNEDMRGMSFMERMVSYWAPRWIRVAGAFQYASAATVAALWNNPGQGFRKGMLRALGTIFGISTAYFVAVRWGTDLSIILFLSISTLIGRFLMCNKALGYAAQTFIATNIFILLAAPINPNVVVNFVAFRAVAVAIGSVIATTFTVLWPIKSDLALRGFMFATLYRISQQLERDMLPRKGGFEVGTWKSFLTGIGKRLRKQEELLVTSVFEPHLLRSAPFPVTSYAIIKDREIVLFDAVVTLLVLVRRSMSLSGETSLLGGEAQEGWEGLTKAIGHVIRSTGRKILRERPLRRLHADTLQTLLDDLLQRFEPSSIMGKKNDDEAVLIMAVLYALQRVIDSVRDLEESVHHMTSRVRATQPQGVPIGSILTGKEETL